MGETAPLILIGMVAFVVDIPTSPVDPSASLPVQVYLWSESAERGFVEKTSATIMILLSFLIVMNFLAVYLRQKFEKDGIKMNEIKIKSKNLNVFYGEKQALFDVNLDLNEKEVTALIGPSGCGKSTFIRCINRMNDVIDICKVSGSIEMDGIDINDKNLDVVSLRERVGMVFQNQTRFQKVFMTMFLMDQTFMEKVKLSLS